MSIKSSYRISKDLAIGNTVSAMRGRQLATTADRSQWIILTFDLSQPPLFHHLIGFIEKISELKHPHIWQIREIETDGNQLRVVCPAARTTLSQRILNEIRSSEETVLGWIFQIASAFQFLLTEARPVFDRLGPLDSGCCVICDHDTVSVNVLELWLRSGIDPTQTVDLTTVVSWAPEYLRWEQEDGSDRDSTGVVDEKGQVWALGIVAYDAAMMSSPFVSEAPLILMDKIMREIPTVSGEFSESFRELLSKKLLAKQPQDRISIQELLKDTLFSKMSIDSQSASSGVLPTFVQNQAPSATRIMTAEQKEVSIPESAEAIEVFGASAVSSGSVTRRTDRESRYSCRLS